MRYEIIINSHKIARMRKREKERERERERERESKGGREGKIYTYKRENQNKRIHHGKDTKKVMEKKY